MASLFFYRDNPFFLYIYLPLLPHSECRIIAVITAAQDGGGRLIVYRRYINLLLLRTSRALVFVCCLGRFPRPFAFTLNKIASFKRKDVDYILENHFGDLF